MRSIRAILHPTDLSERSGDALHVACALARDTGARLTILHVVPRETFSRGAGEIPLDPRIHALEAQLRALPVPEPEIAVEHQVRIGDVVATIRRVVAETSCDLIVIGTHGRTGWDRLLMGSVAEAILRDARCSVLVVKRPASAPISPPHTHSEEAVTT